MQAFLARNYLPLFILFLVLIIGLSAYAGYLEGREAESAQVVLSCDERVLASLTIPTAGTFAATKGSTAFSETVVQPASATAQPVTGGKYVGSKNGTKYYNPSCGSVKRIKLENYVWFQSEEDAILQGYSAGKC